MLGGASAANVVGMRRLSRIALPLLTVALLVGGCRQATTRGAGKTPATGDSKGAVAKVQLPDPLPLPADPEAASWIAEPGKAVALVAPYSPEPVSVELLVRRALEGTTTPELAGAIAEAVDDGAAFGNVVLDGGQEVIRLSVDPDRREALAGALAELESVGEFGAVRLPPKPPSERAEGEPPPRGPRYEWLAWIDAEDDGALVIANSLEGLATGRELAGAYGSEPLFFTIDPGALPLPEPVPVARATGRGTLDELVVDVRMREGEDPLSEAPISAGTLAGLLTGPAITAGLSTRYADHAELVREISSQVNSQVAQLPFLVRGVGESMAAKLNTTLRTWDGRVLVALGPQNRLRLAYGTKDVGKGRVAMLRLLQAAVDNASVARSFSSQVPRITLRRRVAKGDGEDVEMFVLYGASSFLPGELRPLIDDENRLNVAMAWSERVGGGAMVIGADADRALADWLEDTKGAAPGSATSEELLAASFAGEPEQLAPLLRQIAANQAIEAPALFGLAPTGPRWSVDARELEPGHYELRVVTPGAPKAAPPPRGKPKRGKR